MNVNTDDEVGFRDRMNVAIEIAGGIAALARSSGLSDGVLQKYRKGDSDPSRSRLVAIAKATGLSLRWLATGEGFQTEAEVARAEAAVPRSQGWDAELMRDCIVMVNEVAEELDRQLDALTEAKLVFELYDLELERKQQGQRVRTAEVVRLFKTAG